jgi:hypothetical protein
MAKEDVTRQAVKAATKKVAAATDRLKLILFTGPDQVLMTPSEVQKAVEGGNEKLLPYTEAANSTDNSLLDSMLANAQVARRRNGTSRN